MPPDSPQILALKGLESGKQEGVITPLQGNFNAFFVV